MKVFIILKYLMLFQNENKCWSIGNSCGTEIVFFTSSNNHHCNSMSSQSNRNWASTTPGKFLSSLLYLRSKPLVFLQALLKVQLWQNVWGGMRIVCLGLGVREQVPDSPKLHKQHLANGHLKLSTLSASPGSVLWEDDEPLCSATWRPSVVPVADSLALKSLSMLPTPVLEPSCGLLLTKFSFSYCINCWVWCSCAPGLVPGFSPLQRAEGKQMAKVAPCG